MRLDKYLKVSRLIKRRTIAKEVADQGRITLNGQVAKSSSAVKVGDELVIRFGNRLLTVRVTALKENTKKEEANAFEDEYNTFIIPLQKASGDDIASSSPDEFNANKVITSFNI